MFWKTNKPQANAQADIDAYTHWYHTFEVVPGVVTKGEYQLEPIRDYLGNWFKLGEADLAGKSLLDVATFDGGFAFGFEDLGARVEGSDLIDQTHTGFATAHRVRKSPAKFHNVSVYDLDPAKMGPYDLVHFSGLHYHLKHPILALEKVNAVMKVGGTIFGNAASGEFMYREKLPKGMDDAAIHAFLSQLPIAYYDDGKYNGDPTNWIFFGDAAFRTAMERAGFKVEFCKSYAMSNTTSRSTCYFKAVKISDPQPEYWVDNHKLLAK